MDGLGVFDIYGSLALKKSIGDLKAMTPKSASIPDF